MCWNIFKLEFNIETNILRWKFLFREKFDWKILFANRQKYQEKSSILNYKTQFFMFSENLIKISFTQNHFLLMLWLEDISDIRRLPSSSLSSLGINFIHFWWITIQLSTVSFNLWRALNWHESNWMSRNKRILSIFCV